jgi:hypothetical protein
MATDKKEAAMSLVLSVSIREIRGQGLDDFGAG